MQNGSACFVTETAQMKPHEMEYPNKRVKLQSEPRQERKYANNHNQPCMDQAFSSNIRAHFVWW